MGSPTDDPGPTTESEGMNPKIQSDEASETSKGQPSNPDHIEVGEGKIVWEKGRLDLTRNEDRASIVGKPKDLTVKIKGNQELKRAKRLEERQKRKEEYTGERKDGTRKDREMSVEAKKPFTFTLLEVKKEQLDTSQGSKSSPKSSLAKAVEIDLTGNSQVDLAIDLTVDDEEAKKQKRKEKKSKITAVGKGKKGSKKGKNKETTKTKVIVKGKGSKAKGAKKMTSAAQALIDLTKGMGRGKSKAKETKKPTTRQEGFDFGTKKDKAIEEMKEQKVDHVVTPVKKPSEGILKPAIKTGTPTIVNNVYANAAQRAKERSEQTRQTVIASRTKYKGMRRFRVSFSTVKKGGKGKESDLSLSQQSAELRTVMVNILERAKATCKRVGIHPWAGEGCTEMPTIRDTAQIPRTWGEIWRYLTHDDDQFKIQGVRCGSNSRWRVLLNFDMDDYDKFLHLYQNSKGDWDEFPYVPLMEAPMQNPHYHCLGYLIGSSADQPTRVNEAGITEKTEFGVGISYGNIPMDPGFLNDKWEEARNGGNGKRDTFKGAPQGQCVYVDEKSLQKRASMAKKMAKHYSEMVDGKYPVFPDGGRMRFMPNRKLVPFNKRDALETYANLHIMLKKEAIELDIGIKDPNQKISGDGALEGKTIGEMVLGLTAGEADLPIFRHFVKSYSRKFNPELWSVSVHPNMSGIAVETLSNLKEVVTAKYGEEAGMLIHKKESYASRAGMENRTFKPDDTGFDFLNVDKDWYLAGKAKCMIEGMDALKETPEEKRAMDNAINSIDESKMTFLSNANTAEEERTVATEGGVSFGTASYMSKEGDESTVVMQSANMDELGYIPPGVSNTEDSNMAIEEDTGADTGPPPSDTEMKNGTEDGLGGSGTQAVSEGEWKLHGTVEDERSLFSTAITYGLASLSNRFSTPDKGSEGNGSGLGPGVSIVRGIQEP